VPKPRSKVAEALSDLSGGLRELGVEWYLFGAQAALLYGAARLTADIDATVMLGDRPPTELVEALKGWRLAPRIDDPRFIEQTRVMPLVHEPTRFPVDLVLGGPGLEELFATRAVERDVAGVRVPVARAEDLVVMKILAGRDKDRTDIEAVLFAQRGTLDLPLIRETLRLVEEALDQSDLTPAFEAALRLVSAL
jgi:hypothetical protein